LRVNTTFAMSLHPATRRGVANEPPQHVTAPLAWTAQVLSPSIASATAGSRGAVVTEGDGIGASGSPGSNHGAASGVSHAGGGPEPHDGATSTTSTASLRIEHQRAGAARYSPQRRRSNRRVAAVGAAHRGRWLARTGAIAHPGAMTRFRLVLACVVSLAGCREHRRIDATPVESTSATEVPAGVVQASFELNTGGDQMSSRPVDAGLVLRVAYGRKLFRQQLASCQDAGRGDALAGGSSAVDWAICDQTSYSLHITDTRVEVHSDRSTDVVTAIALPPGLHLTR
jgi:hypothetical protein